MEKVLKVAVMLSAIDKMSGVIKSASDSGIKSLTRMQKEADKLSKSAFDFGRQAGVFGLAIAAPLGMAVKAASEYEQMNVSLKTAFQGNEAAAKKAFGVINDFAMKTPYEMEEVMKSFIKLKNMGMDPSTKALEAYGNTASAMGKSLNDMVEAVADAATGEFERLKEFGIRASSQGDKVQFTFQGVTTTVRKNSKQIELYLKNLGLTKFAGGIEAQSKTFNGMMSTMKDQVKQFAVTIGNQLIPMLKDIFTKIGPILDQVAQWIKENPKLTKYIVLGTAALAALSLTASALAFTFGGLIKVVSFGASVFKYAGIAMRFIGSSMMWVGRVMMANPIILIITAIAVAALLIYKYWDQIKAFFSKLWEGVKSVFSKFWNWIKNLFMNYTPYGLIIKHWDKIKAFFSGLWDAVKSVFANVWNWIKKLLYDMNPVVLIYKNWDKIVAWFGNLWENVKSSFGKFIDYIFGLPKEFLKAGENIIDSLWNGMKAKFNDMIKWFKDGLKEMREYLPFSPAKRGPLMDIHRVKIVETIASSIKPGPMVNAMKNVTSKVRGVMPKGTGLTPGMAMAGGSGGGAKGGGAGVVVHFSPSITLNGGAGQNDRESFLTMLKHYQPELMRVIEDAVSRRERAKF